MIEIIINFTESVLWVIFQSSFHCFRKGKLKNTVGFIFTTMALMCNIQLADSVVMYSSYTAIVDFIILSFYSKICLNGNWKWKSFSILLYNICLFVCNYLCIVLFLKCFSILPEEIFMKNTKYRFIFLIVTKIVLVSICIVILKCKEKFNILKRVNAMIVMLPIVVVGIISLVVDIFVDYYKSGGQANNILILMFLFCGMFFICFYLLKYTVLEYEQRIQNELMKRQIQNQRELFIQQYENIRKVRRVQHDLKHKLVVVMHLLQEGKTERAKTYLGNFLAELESVGHINYDENIWKNLLLLKQEKTKELSVEWEIDIEEQGLKKIDPIDMCVILGNLLDNAIEAEERIVGDRKILVVIRERDNMIYLKIENCIEMLPSGRDRESTKWDKELHGFGIKCVKEIIEKYGGLFKIDNNRGYYMVEIII